MWLTGFDVPSMATMYIDKPMKGHNLMQAIARVNRVYKDKEAGLIVDYIGMAAELKSALSQYTKRDQDKIPDLGQALSIALEKLEIMRDMFYGFDYSDFFGQDDSVRLAVIANGVNFALGMEADEQKSFMREATALSQAETLCRSILDIKLKQEIEFFKCVKAGICKTAGRMGITTNEINARIMKLLEQAIEQDGVYNIFAEAGKKNPEISILSEEYMEKILNEQRDATLCYLDLDGLKYVNDTFGHSQGDAYIQNFVELIRSCFRNGDTFARIGGDEFCLVLTGRMKDLIDKKLAAILDSFQSESDSEYQCSFSYGTVEIAGKDNELTLDEIIQKADSIMYKCKRKNKVKYPELIR